MKTEANVIDETKRAAWEDLPDQEREALWVMTEALYPLCAWHSEEI